MTGPAAGTHRVAAVVPVIDEATAIGELTAGLRVAGACCVFVVDGGSRDGTPEVARAAGGTVIIEPRRGYGRACLTGASAATVDHPVVAFLDGDGSCDPADLPALVAALDDADLVLGARTSRTTEAGALPWHARLGNMLVAALLRRRTGGRVRDLPPFKVIRREALAVLDLDDAGFGWTVQLVARALRAPGLRVTETPVRFRRRRGGRSKVSGSIRASYAAGRRMIGCALAETRRRPVIALMAKAPRAGHAKTRLAADIGQEAALGLWAACLADLGPSIRGAARGVADTIAVVPAAADAGPVAALLGPGWSTIVQQRSGLGGAITDGFVEAERLGADRAIAVSGDNPTLPAGLLLAALDALRRHGCGARAEPRRRLPPGRGTAPPAGVARPEVPAVAGASRGGRRARAGVRNGTSRWRDRAGHHGPRARRSRPPGVPARAMAGHRQGRGPRAPRADPCRCQRRRAPDARVAGRTCRAGACARRWSGAARPDSLAAAATGQAKPIRPGRYPCPASSDSRIIASEGSGPLNPTRYSSRIGAKLS